MIPCCSPFSRRDPCFEDGAEEDDDDGDDVTGVYIEWWVGS
jgi:hypothetical protein